MKNILFVCIVTFIFGNVLNSNDNFVKIDNELINRVEGQVIKVLFDILNIDESKKEKIVIFFPNNDGFGYLYRPANVLAWFKYGENDQHAIVNYFSFPRYEKVSELFPNKNYLQISNQNNKRFNAFLKEIISNKTINVQEAKQLVISLPQSLQDDISFEKMLESEKSKITYYSDDGTPTITIGTVGGGNFYYLGYKSSQFKLICDTTNYNNQHIAFALEPIMYTILRHETPIRWSVDIRRHNEAETRKRNEQKKDTEKGQSTEFTEEAKSVEND